MEKNSDKNNFIGVSGDINEFSCGICHEIFVNPVFTQCCQQSFCSECINKWLERKNICPYDRQPLTRNGLSQPPRAFMNLFKNLKIKCNFHSKGCQQLMKINDLENHLLNCDFRPNQLCKTCGIVRKLNESHDCLENLKNNELNEKNKELMAKNNELNEINKKLMVEISKYLEEKESSEKIIEDLTKKNLEIKSECFIVSFFSL